MFSLFAIFLGSLKFFLLNLILWFSALFGGLFMAFMVSHNFLEPGPQLSRCSSYFFLRCSFVELLISVFSSFILRCGTGPLSQKEQIRKKNFRAFHQKPYFRHVRQIHYIFFALVVMQSLCERQKATFF